MPIVHYLNVGNGDCSIIEHVSKRITVIDVNLAHKETQTEVIEKVIFQLQNKIELTNNTKGNYNQKAHPENPITYLNERGLDRNVFRFILTHPDKDHMGGLKEFCESFSPTNFWDIVNTKELNDSDEDWKYYQEIRAGKHSSVRYYRAGAKQEYFNLNNNGSSGGDGIFILSPTPEIVADSLKTGDYNDASYVLLYNTMGKRILFSGDAHDKTWESVLDKYGDLIQNIDVLIAPHHGRDSERDYSFLEIVNPKLTLFGNASSEHLAYEAWSNKNLEIITNNEAGNIVMDIQEQGLFIQVSNEKFAKNYNEETYWDEILKSWVIKKI